MNLENESVSERLLYDTYRVKPAEFGEILEALHVPATMLYPNSGAKFTRTMGYSFGWNVSVLRAPYMFWDGS
jgi:hypothetical protein